MYKTKKHLNKLVRISKTHDFFSKPGGIYLNRNERTVKFPKSIIKLIKNSNYF